jgi:hypothetical protein
VSDREQNRDGRRWSIATTIQQEKLTLLISSGMTIAAAGRGAGTVLSLQALDKYRMIGFENPLVSHPLLH